MASPSKNYDDLIDEIKRYFPELEDVASDRTEHDIDTLTYSEFGRELDILYSGSGLQHFIDVLVKVTLSKANVILLDEPEHGLHPSLQRRFIEYVIKLAEDKDLQIFMATHSPVILNYASQLSKYRVINNKRVRTVTPVPQGAVETLLGDLGIRPSDLFNRDICVMVEGKDDVIYFEHVIDKIYSSEFKSVSIAVLQYNGDGIRPIIKGELSIANIVSAQKFTCWICDRDAKPTEPPHEKRTELCDALAKSGVKTKILDRRELEYYYPEDALIAAQNCNVDHENAVRDALNGPQAQKFRNLRKEHQNLVIPSGNALKISLQKHLTTKDDVPEEFKSLIEGTLFDWRNQILGD